ncbi:outer membrane beta-barrel protein [Pontimicrobium aquaticum]|uniref:PorT family protein n=1 Tax=Pontimicrobium aquaticum TaxID=2565367 RepID=A0A4U0EZM4_9FLAO|nr:outer membrane beta-barrel protein [Pontimicrobium aquaticum]TJY37388.1 PorT family protein [Pontimicrobium aquaticum]
MKKLLVIGLLLSSLLSNSQNEFGVITGISNSSFSDGFLEKASIDKAFGFHLGGLYQYNISNDIIFRPKIIFSLQGDRKKSTGDSSAFGIDYKLSYINLPLNFKFFSKPYIIAGPQVGYLLSTKKGDIDIGDIENKVDFGLNVGFGYDFDKFFVEFNMYQGIAKLIDLENNQTSIRYGSISNTVLQLSLGYYFK